MALPVSLKVSRRGIALAVAVIALTAAGPFLVPFLGHIAAAQGFSDQDAIFISRNAALEDLSRSDPAGARRVLDLLRAPRERPEGGPREIRPRVLQMPEDPLFDPRQNPDLVVLQRSSPEAAYELLQILKRAAAGKGPR